MTYFIVYGVLLGAAILLGNYLGARGVGPRGALPIIALYMLLVAIILSALTKGTSH